MHKDYVRADSWTREVIGAAIEVHKLKGPGLLEDIYERCLRRELELRDIPTRDQVEVPVEYKGKIIDHSLRMDLYVDDCLVVELKAVEKVMPIHKAQLMSYMNLVDAPLGLLMNFHSLTMIEGISRMLLPGANKA